MRPTEFESNYVYFKQSKQGQEKQTGVKGEVSVKYKGKTRGRDV